MSKLIPASAAPGPVSESNPPTAPEPVTPKIKVPLDVARAIEREAAHDPSDPFLARRLAAHYRQGIWSPADGGK